MAISGPVGSPSPYPVLPGHGDAPDGPAPGGVPAPPPGPGVSPPFATPPTEGRTVRMWIGLGVAALAVVLCCGGGAAALVGLMVAGTQAVNEQARTVVGNYFQAVTHKDYTQAYGLLCDADQQRESVHEYELRVSSEPAIASYQVHDATVGNQVIVPVDVMYVGGSPATLRVMLVPDTRTGVLEVCGFG